MRLVLHPHLQTWQLDDMEEVHVQLLRQAAEDASMTDCPEGRRRLRPLPVPPESELAEERFIDDWNDFVAGEIETELAEDVGTLLSDLDGVETRPSGTAQNLKFSLTVPIPHGKSWFSALNQARLMLDKKYILHPEGGDFDPDGEMEPLKEIHPHERLAAYMRYEFYALIQEWLVRHTM